jgi:RNA polymerase sigma-70 factor (ECF subfamily)
MNFDIDCKQESRQSYFSNIFKKYRPRLLSLARRMTFSEEGAEDVVQDSYADFLSNFERYNGGSAVFTYLYRLVINKSIDYLRKNRSRKKLEQALKNGMNTGREQSEIKIIVREALEKLDRGYRIPLMLLEFENQSYEEIAQILAISPGNVKVRIFRARQKLIKILERMGVDGNVL